MKPTILQIITFILQYLVLLCNSFYELYRFNMTHGFVANAYALFWRGLRLGWRGVEGDGEIHGGIGRPTPPAQWGTIMTFGQK